jgi:hypothetical protein
VTLSAAVRPLHNQTLQWTGPALSALVNSKPVGAVPAIERWSVIPPMLPWDLEDWLTDEGDRVVRKSAAANSDDVLDATDRLLQEFWLLDTEQRNGGLSQYFCNHGSGQWKTLSRLAASTLPTFATFAAKVDEVINDSNDPYQAIIDSDVKLDAWYYENQLALVRELQVAVRRAG